VELPRNCSPRSDGSSDLGCKSSDLPHIGQLCSNCALDRFEINSAKALRVKTSSATMHRWHTRTGQVATE